MNTRRLALLAVATLTLSACTPSVSDSTSLGSDPFATTAPTPATDTTLAEQQVTSDAAQSQTGAHPGELPALPKLPVASGTLHLVVDEEAALPQVLVDDFATATGVDVQVTTMRADTGPVVADLFIGFDGDTLIQSDTANILSPSAPGVAPQHPLSGAPSAVDYARDDVCVLADHQWYALNRQTAPDTLAALSAPQIAKQLVLAPSESSTSRAFNDHVTKALGSQAGTWLAAITAGALTPTSWDEAAQASTVRLREQPGTRSAPGRQQWASSVPATNPASFPQIGAAVASAHEGAQSGQGTQSGEHPAQGADAGGAYPLRVAPVSVAARATTNTQTSGYVLPVEGSCAERYVYVATAKQASNPGAAQAMIAYVVSPRAQRILALTGAAIPLEAAAAQDTVIDWYAAIKK